jgi:hypothetical protein
MTQYSPWLPRLGMKKVGALSRLWIWVPRVQSPWGRRVVQIPVAGS